MADSKISALSAVTTLVSTDEYVTARAGATKKITGASLRATFQDAPYLSFVSTRYTTLGLALAASTFGGSVMAQDTAIFTPFSVTYNVTFDRIGINVNATVGSSNVRVGIYNDAGTGVPTTLVADYGLLDAHTGTGFVEATISQALTPGRYWVCTVPQGATANLLTHSMDGMSRSTGAVATGFAVGSYQQAGVSGALNASAGTMADGAAASPRVAARVV